MQHAGALYCSKTAGRANGSGETTAWSSNHSCIIVRTWQLLQRPKDKRLNNIACFSLLQKPELMGVEWVVWDAPCLVLHPSRVLPWTGWPPPSVPLEGKGQVEGTAFPFK